MMKNAYNVQNTGSNRMKYMKIIAAVLMTGIVLLSGCSGTKEYEWKKPSTPGTPTEQKIESNTSGQFVIIAAGNATTGYIWEASFDQEYVNLISSDYVVDNPGLMGSGGKNRFTFQSLKQGETKIVLVYKRPWEHDIAETAAFIVTIR